METANQTGLSKHADNLDLPGSQIKSFCFGFCFIFPLFSGLFNITYINNYFTWFCPNNWNFCSSPRYGERFEHRSHLTTKRRNTNFIIIFYFFNIYYYLLLYCAFSIKYFYVIYQKRHAVFYPISRNQEVGWKTRSSQVF